MTEEAAKNRYVKLRRVLITFMAICLAYLGWAEITRNAATIVVTENVNGVCQQDTAAAAELERNGTCTAAEKVQPVLDPDDPDPNDPDADDPDPDDPEIQEPEFQDPDPNDPDPTNDGEVQDPDTDDPDPDDPELQDREVQDPEIQDPEVDDPDPATLPQCREGYTLQDRVVTSTDPLNPVTETWQVCVKDPPPDG